MVVLTDSAAYPNLDYYELNLTAICQKLVGVCFVTMIMFKFFVGLNLHAGYLFGMLNFTLYCHLVVE